MTAGEILRGMRIVEVSAFVAAPLGGMSLAQLGADVIRIDPPTGGLDYRRWPVTVDGTSLFWCGLNKGKRSVAIDVSAPEGRELASALVCAPGDGGGILLTNMPARGWLDHEALRGRRQDLVQLTFQGTRDGGSAVDYTINPRTGLPFITGPGNADGAVNHVLPVWDLVSGQAIAVGLLAADRARSRTGQSQHVKLSLEDVALSVMAHLGYIAEAQLGQDRPACGNYLYGAFGRDFTCRHGDRVMVVGLTLKQWRSLCKATGIDEQVRALEQRLSLDFGREGERFQAREPIAALLEPWFAARTIEEVSGALDQHGVCWGRYQSVRQMVEKDLACSPNNPMFSVVDQPGVGQILSPGSIYDFDGAARGPALAAPRLGEHTELVLAEVLGIGQGEFGKLLARRIVSTSSSEDARFSR